MKIGIFLFVIFIFSFMLLFGFVYSVNKKEDDKDNMLVLIIVAILFSLIITMVIAFFLFIIIGSTSAIDILFSLNINTGQIITIGISYLIYIFTIDSIVEKILEYLLGKNIIHYFALALTRIGAFYIIGIIINVSQEIILTLSIGVSVIILLFEVLYFVRQAKKNAEK